MHANGMAHHNSIFRILKCRIRNSQCALGFYGSRLSYFSISQIRACFQPAHLVFISNSPTDCGALRGKRERSNSTCTRSASRTCACAGGKVLSASVLWMKAVPALVALVLQGESRAAETALPDAESTTTPSACNLSTSEAHVCAHDCCAITSNTVSVFST